MAYLNILLETDGGVATITINRPKVLNALNGETIAEINGALDEIIQDSKLRAVIITGAGDKAFVAGADIAFMQELSPLVAREFARKGQNVFSRIENFPLPVIAAINGFALGGGLELAMACDIRVAVPEARVGQPEVNLGIMAGFGGTQRLSRLVNPGLAKEILFTADMYDAQTAKQMGLLNHVVERGQLMDFCRAMAGRIASRGPVAVRLTKEAINEGLAMDMEKALAHEADLFAVTFTTTDREEGIKAFLEKRKPVFAGK